MRPIFHSITKVQKVQIQFSKNHGIAYKITIKLVNDIKKTARHKTSLGRMISPEGCDLLMEEGHLFI